LTVVAMRTTCLVRRSTKLAEQTAMTLKLIALIVLTVLKSAFTTITAHGVIAVPPECGINEYRQVIPWADTLLTVFNGASW
jgi:hypothetical protein